MKTKEIERVEKSFSMGKITRRDFLARMSALGITAALTPALLPDISRAAKPQKRGRFRMGKSIGHVNDTFDPTLMKDQGAFIPSWGCRNNLVEVDYKGRAIPELAEDWEVSSNFETWIFNLRKGVEFHNGKTLEAEDVIYSLNLHRGETKSAAKSLLKAVKEIKADGKFRVIITLASGGI